MESLPVLSLVVVGFVLRMIGVLKSDDGSFFSRIILFITLPCLIFLSISQAQIESDQLAILALAGLTIPLVLRILSGVVTRLLKLEDSIAGVVILCSMVMNVGAMMIPVVQTVFGADGVSRTAAFDIGNSFMASGYGYFIASRYGTKNSDGILKSIKCLNSQIEDISDCIAITAGSKYGSRFNVEAWPCKSDPCLIFTDCFGFGIINTCAI